MRAITTIFFTDSLASILGAIEQTPDLDPHRRGLHEFKDTLIQRVQQLRAEDRRGLFHQDDRAA